MTPHQPSPVSGVFKTHFVSARVYDFEPRRFWEFRSRLMMDNMVFFVEVGNLRLFQGSQPAGLFSRCLSGQICLFPAGSVANAFKKKNTRFKVWVLHFSAVTPEGRDIFESISEPLVFNPNPDSLYGRLVQRMATEEKTKAPQWLDACQGFCAGAIPDLFRHTGLGKQLSLSGAPTPPTRMSAAVAYMGKHLNEKLPVWRIAEFTGLSESRFSKLFVKEMGVSPNNYLLKIRIREAIRLRQKEGWPWERISRAVGFPDVFYFFRVFKKVLGQTPKHYMQTRAFDKEE